jgi:hypothetical protein
MCLAVISLCGGRRVQVGLNPATVPILTRLVLVVNKHSTAETLLSQSPITQKESSSAPPMPAGFAPVVFPRWKIQQTVSPTKISDADRTATGMVCRPRGRWTHGLDSNEQGFCLTESLLRFRLTTAGSVRSSIVDVSQQRGWARETSTLCT